MNWQEFEDGLKDRVGDHQTPLDTEALWDQVQPRKRRRRALFWWWFGGIGLLGSLAGIWMREKSQSESSQPGHLRLQVETTRTQQKAPGESVYQQSVDPGKYQNTPHSAVGEVAAKWKKTERKNPDNQNTFGMQRPDGEASMNDGDTRPVPVGNAVDSSVFTHQDTSMLALEPVPEISIIQPDHPAINPFFTPLSVLPEFVFSTNPAYPALPGFPAPGPPLQSLYPDEKTTSQWGIYAGFAYWNKFEGFMEGPIPLRAKEHLREAFNLGVFYQKPIGRSWALRAGIQYQRFNSVFKWQKSWTTPDQEQQVLNYYSDGSIDTSYLPGALIETTRTVRHYNRITAINLPIDIKYNLPAGKGSLQAFIGVQPWFLQRAKGVVLRASDEPDYARFGPKYNRNFGLSVRAGMSMQWPLTKHFSFMLEPVGTFDLTRRTANGSPERFLHAGMNVGIVYRK